MTIISVDEVSSIQVERKGIDLVWTVNDHEDKVTGTVEIGYEAFTAILLAIQDTMHVVSFVEDKVAAEDFAALAIPGDAESAKRFKLRAQIVEEIHRICTGIADGSIREADLEYALQVAV
jgi:hypothetical protein